MAYFGDGSQQVTQSGPKPGDWGGWAQATRDRQQAMKSQQAGNFTNPYFQQQYGQYSSLGNQYAGRQAPQMGDSAFRGNQSFLVGQLQNQMMGHGPGQELVRQQAQQQSDRILQQQLGSAAGSSPGNSAMMARGAALGAGQAQSAVGGQAAMGGLQAQLGAAGMLGNVLQGARGQDLSRNQANAQFSQQQMGMNSNDQLAALQQRMQAAGMQQQGGMTYEQMLSAERIAQMQADAAKSNTRMNGMLGAATGLGSAYMMGGPGGAAAYGATQWGTNNGGGMQQGNVTLPY